MARELGRTRLYTRRERRRVVTAVALAVLGVLVCVAVGSTLVSLLTGGGLRLPTLGLRPLITGRSGGGLLGLPSAGHPTAAPGHAQLPIAVGWPASPGWSAAAGVLLWLLWCRVVCRPWVAGLRGEARHQGLATVRGIRAHLGRARVRRAGRFTRPGAPVWARWLLPTAAFGYFLGRPLQPRARAGVWADWEQRVRIIARTGWGKTVRLLVPITRALPGAALVSSTEPGIFEQTVTARRYRRRPLRWRPLALVLRRWLPLVEYPIAVVDFSAPETRFTAGYPRVRWSPIVGAEDFSVAYRRAAGMVAGVETDGGADRGSDSDRFFRDSATEVAAAWLHAAALGGKELDELMSWLVDPADPAPQRILEDEAHRADPTAITNLAKHLDPKAGKTTSGVERYLTLGLNALGTVEGRELVGRRFDAAGHPVEQFDMPGFIAAGGTLYVLADPQRIDRARPLLSMVAAEMFIAAEYAALLTRRKRLPVPFIAVLDELRYGVTVWNLPYVASSLRKYNIGYVYSVQSATQEDVVYGHDADALRDAAGVTLYGGIDISSAKEITERAGTTPVVTATRGHDIHSEHIQIQDTFTIGDQQKLADGDATVIARGLPPFTVHVPSLYDNRAGRRIQREAETVARQVEAARAAEAATRRSHATAAAAGAGFGTHRGQP